MVCYPLVGARFLFARAERPRCAPAQRLSMQAPRAHRRSVSVLLARPRCWSARVTRIDRSPPTTRRRQPVRRPQPLPSGQRAGPCPHRVRARACQALRQTHPPTPGVRVADARLRESNRARRVAGARRLLLPFLANPRTTGVQRDLDPRAAQRAHDQRRQARHRDRLTAFRRVGLRFVQSPRRTCCTLPARDETIASRSALRARNSRDFTVPGGISSMWLISR